MGRIEISGLSKSYDGVPAVADLDITIEDGEFITLLGPSGCGKTTTLNLLAGFLKPDSGRIAIDGVTVSEPGRVVEPGKRGMGMVFQNYALWPHKSVFGNVAYGLQRMKVPRHEVRERVDRILDMVGLEGFNDRLPGQLSGGQQQRVALARSLVTEPGMLLLDEPLSNLDAKLRAQMRFEVQQIQRRLGTTFVYVTHDQIEALSMSDRIAVMNRGRLEQMGTPSDVYLSPATAFVADFMGLINFLPGTVASADGGSELSVRLGSTDCLVRAQNAPHQPKADSGASVIVGVRPEVVGLSSFESGPPDLLTGEVTHVVVLGNIIQYDILTAGQTIKVQGSYSSTYKVGEKVRLTFDEQRVLCYSAVEETLAFVAGGTASESRGGEGSDGQ